MRSPIKYLLAVLVAALLAITTAEAQTVTYITAKGTTNPTWTINGPGTSGVSLSTAGIATGAVLRGTSATTAAYGPVNLASGTAVTGVLPTANQASQSLGGDLGGTTASATVNAVSGTSPISITPNELRFVTGASPLIDQAVAGSGITPANLAINPQSPNAGSGTTASGTPGNLTIKISTPVSTGTEGYVQQFRGSNLVSQIGPWTGGNTISAWWLSGNPTGSFTPSNTNYTVLSTGGNTYFGSVTHSYLTVGGNSGVIQTLTLGSVQLFSSTISVGGGTNVVGVTNASVVPSSNPSAGGLFYSSNGSGVWRGSGGAITSFGLSGSGTQNSQAGVAFADMGFLRTVSSSTATTIYSYTTASNTSGRVKGPIVCRAITAPTAGAIGDSWSTDVVDMYRNVAGTVTTVGTPVFGNTLSDTSMAGTTASVAVSGTAVLIQVSNVASATVDCTYKPEILVN